MIEIKKINIDLGDFKLKDIDLKIESGEYFVILGPSGAGKTVILELIAGLIKADSGVIQGIDSKRSALIYQDYMLFPHLNIFDNIAFGLKVRKKKKDEIKSKVNSAADKLGIANLLNRSVLTLSGGESQRVAIARASVTDPEVFLLDEPTAALDSGTRTGILELLKDLHSKNKNTFIHVTHNFEEALYLADRIAVIKDGKLIQTGTPNEIFNHPTSKFVADFVGFENVFYGSVKDGRFTLENDPDFILSANCDTCESVYLALKSEDVIVSKEKFESSARNSFLGTVTEVINRLSGNEIVFMINKTKLISAVTKISTEELGIKEGSQFWLTFKTSSLKIFPH
jgi:molybdopterin-binding protein